MYRVIADYGGTDQVVWESPDQIADDKAYAVLFADRLVGLARYSIMRAVVQRQWAGKWETEYVAA